MLLIPVLLFCLVNGLFIYSVHLLVPLFAPLICLYTIYILHLIHLFPLVIYFSLLIPPRNPNRPSENVRWAPVVIKAVIKRLWHRFGAVTG